MVGLRSGQSVPVRVTVDGKLIHNQLGHRTVAQVDMHVRRSGQLAAIELGERHCSGLCYVNRHGHVHDGQQSLLFGGALASGTFALPGWIVHFECEGDCCRDLHAIPSAITLTTRRK